MSFAAPTDRTRIRRVAENACYDPAVLATIIDDAYVCHIAFVDAQGAVHNIPTACWRLGAHLYVHGSNGARLTRALAAGTQVCVTITHVDGLVLARSAFNHSMNYRAAMVYGRFEVVAADADKRASLEAFMEKIMPGRQAQVRPGSDKEYAATTVLRLALSEAACKVRSGGPEDDAADLDWPVWAGHIPFIMQRGEPVPDTPPSR